VDALLQSAWILAFACCTMAMLFAPFVPAIVEWLRPTDTGPLAVTREYDGDIRYFAQFFERLCREGAGAALGEAQAQRRNDVLATLGRDQFRLLGDPAAWTAGLAPGILVREGVVSCAGLALPERATFEREVLAYGSLRIGADTVVRSAMAIEDLDLGDGSAVMRWADAGRDLTLGDRACVLGRATAAGEIRLGVEVEFQRMRARRIVVGAAPEPAEPQGLTEIAIDGTALDIDARFVRVDGNLNIAPRSRVSVSLIVGGDVTVGALAAIDGGIKSHGRVVIGRGAQVNGAICAVRAVRLEAGAAAAGPVLSEDVIELAYGARVGTPEAPSTVSAERIILEEGAVVCGTLWARQVGATRSISRT